MTDKTIPAGADPDNTLILETGPGVIVIKLRNDIAPQHAERLKQLAFYTLAQAGRLGAIEPALPAPGVFRIGAPELFDC